MAGASMGKRIKPWFLPTRELVSGVSRYTELLHRVIALAGLILGGGGSALEQFGLSADFLDVLGVMLGFVIGFSLLAIAPLSLVSLIVSSPSRQLVAQNLMVWIFIGVLWFREEMDWLVTTAFLCYALTVLVVWLRGTLGKEAK